MAHYRENLVDIELQSGTIFRNFLNYSIGKGDNMANRFGVRLFRNNEAVNLGGATCQAIFMAPDGQNILISGSDYTYVSGNVAYVQLPQACYNVEGQFTLAIKVIGDGVTGTMRIIDGNVDNTGVTGAVAPVESVPTYEEIIDVYDEMLAAKDGCVRFDIEQELSQAQKTRARTNIDSISPAQVNAIADEITSKVNARSPFAFVAKSEYEIKNDDIVQGTASQDDPYTISASTIRIRVLSPVKVNKGDRIHFAYGTNVTRARLALYANDQSFISEGWVQSANVEIAQDGYAVIGFAKGTDVDILPSEYDATVTIDLKNRKLMQRITEESEISGVNMLDVEGIHLYLSANGGVNYTRAISEPILLKERSVTIHCRNLPGNLKYEIEMYTSSSLSSYVGSKGSWNTTGDVVIANIEQTERQYIRILFAKSDNSVLKESDFDGLEMQVEYGIQPTEYTGYYTFIDSKARKVTEKLEDNYEIAGTNIFDRSSVMFGLNAIGGANAARAISGAIFLPTNKRTFTVYCDNLPAGIKYEIEMYTDSAITSFVGSKGTWITSADPVTLQITESARKYIRVLFAKTDGTEIYKSDLNDLRMQIEYGESASAYEGYYSAIDYVARKQSGSAGSLNAKALENAITDQKFIPYSVGVSTDTPVSTGQYNRCNILFFTDSHTDYINPDENAQNVLDTIEYANRAPFHLDAIVNAGDVITPFGVNTKASSKELFAVFADRAKRSSYPILFAKGNHDLNDWGNTPANTFTDEDWSDMWYDYAETKWGIVRQTKSSGKKSTWNYYDIEDHKIRIITVDCQDTDKTVTDENGKVLYHGGNAWYVSDEQMNWIASTALNFDDKDETDWGVIVVLHQKPNYSTILEPAFESSIQKLLLLCKAFNTQSTYTEQYTFATDSFYNLDVSADFTRYAELEDKPHMICWLLGHEHYDQNYVSEGINIILTENAACFTSASDNRVARIAETNTQNCFDLISIDTVTRKIRMIRYGAGKNCFGGGGDRFLPDGLSY